MKSINYAKAKVSAGPLLGKLRPRVPLPLRMGLSLFCDMNCPFLDSNLWRREAKRVGEYAGHLRKREAGCLFREVELKIEHGHSTVAWTLQTLGFVPLFLFSAFLVSPVSFSSVLQRSWSSCCVSAGMQPL